VEARPRGSRRAETGSPVQSPLSWPNGQVCNVGSLRESQFFECPIARVAALDAADQQDDQESRETFRRRSNADDATLIVEIALRDHQAVR
jgi:hypothetical protein